MAVMSSAQAPAPSTPSVPLSELRVVSLPEQQLVDHLNDRVPGFRYVLWDMAGDPVGARADEIDMAVAPYFTGGWIEALPAATRLRLVQLQSTGFDGVPEAVGADLALSTAGWATTTPHRPEGTCGWSPSANTAGCSAGTPPTPG